MKLILIGMITQIIYWTLFVILWSSFVNGDSIRGLKEIIDYKPIPCNPGTNGSSCICPDVIKSDFTGCLKYEESINGCHPINCWKWNEIKNQCEEDGKPFVPAIILQSIPFTGAFGSGFGNIGRWDIFGTYMIIVFGGCLFVCCCGMGCSCATKDKDDKDSFVKLGTNCGACIWSIAITSMWIWGIVVIANKEVDAPFWDWKGNKIMCPLVG